MQPQPNQTYSTMEDYRQQEHAYQQEAEFQQEAQAPESNFFTETIDLLKQYISDRITLIKLQSIEKVSAIAASIVSGVILAVLGLFFLVFLSITLGFLLASWLDSNTAGFGIVAGIYLLLIILVVAFGKKLFGNLVTKKIIQNTFKKKDGQQ